ncbi:MAG: hypothetical protein LBU64_00290 [Planctomycetota bacterium]|jgi:hypothetical protein|nr:hypothetical protein [Planctomycetota bacterium]
MPVRKLLGHYRQRGAFEDRLGKWNALGVNLSQNDFAKNEVTPLLSPLAANLLEILRGEMESAADPRLCPPCAQRGPIAGGKGEVWTKTRQT